MSTSLDAHGIAVLLLTGLALVLFTREHLPLESSALFVLIVLALGLHFFPYEAPGVQLGAIDVLAGCGNEALIAILALLACSRALEATGALRPVAYLLAAVWRRRPKLAFLAALLLFGVLSMFVNNTPVVAMMLPLLISVCLRAGVPPSRVLMPVGFATIVGGMATTIGTSTNLLVVSLASKLGARPIGMFDYTPLVLVAFAAAILYLWLLAPRLLPIRHPRAQNYSVRQFHALLRIVPGSPATGQTLAGIQQRTGQKIHVTAIERDDGLFLARLQSVVLRPGDRLYACDSAARLKELERELGATLESGAETQRRKRGRRGQADAPESLAEILVTRGSPFYGRRPSALPLLMEHGVRTLALHRARGWRGGEVADQRTASDQRLRDGDIVLVQGSEQAIRALKTSGSAIVLDGSFELPHSRRAPQAALVMAGVILCGALGILPISVAAVTGLGAMLLMRCLSWRQALETIDRRLVMIIVASLALGQALAATGGAAFLAGLFVQAFAGVTPAIVASGLMLIMSLITEVVTNNAAAVLGTPIALSIAQGLGADSEPLLLAVLFGANMSYLTPIGYQTNLLVFSAGGYHFRDFIRVGLLLQIIVWGTLSIMLKLVYFPG